MILACTGHGPDKLGGYDQQAKEKLTAFAIAMLERYRPTEVVSGMALGWDQALARAAIQLGIPLTAARPFRGQESAWPLEPRLEYRDLLDRAQMVVTVCEGEGAAGKMQKRDEWMIKRCNALLALWDGSAGGTANCVNCAKKQENVSIWNVWPDWLKFPL